MLPIDESKSKSTANASPETAQPLLHHSVFFVHKRSWLQNPALVSDNPKKPRLESWRNERAGSLRCNVSYTLRERTGGPGKTLNFPSTSRLRRLASAVSLRAFPLPMSVLTLFSHLHSTSKSAICARAHTRTHPRLSARRNRVQMKFTLL